MQEELANFPRIKKGECGGGVAQQQDIFRLITGDEHTCERIEDITKRETSGGQKLWNLKLWQN